MLPTSKKGRLSIFSPSIVQLLPVGSIDTLCHALHALHLSLIPVTDKNGSLSKLLFRGTHSRRQRDALYLPQLEKSERGKKAMGDDLSNGYFRTMWLLRYAAQDFGLIPMFTY